MAAIVQSWKIVDTCTYTMLWEHSELFIRTNNSKLYKAWGSFKAVH